MSKPKTRSSPPPTPALIPLERLHNSDRTRRLSVQEKDLLDPAEFDLSVVLEGVDNQVGDERVKMSEKRMLAEFMGTTIL